MRRSTWNTYYTSGYTHDVANDPPSQGGVHKYQVRKISGVWQSRILQTNGRHSASGPISVIADDLGEERFWKASSAHARL